MTFTSSPVPVALMPRPLTWHEAREWSPWDRVMHYCVEQNGCLVWTGAVTAEYGIVQIAGHSHRVHQWVWEEKNGPLPVGHNLHHTSECTTKRCVRHLQLLEAGEHSRLHGLRGQGLVNSQKTKCDAGHPLDASNTYVEMNKAGEKKRHCKKCRATRLREWRARQKLRGVVG